MAPWPLWHIFGFLIRSRRNNLNQNYFLEVWDLKGYWRMRAVITVIGKDMVGILAKVSTTCAAANANVIEVTQSVLQEFFAMVMLIDLEKMNCELSELRENLNKNVDGMTIHVMHEDIFNSMHRI
jgi:ACT domain-containing protein